ncbi:unnamed protein product, partial [Ranitomeya imitator]
FLPLIRFLGTFHDGTNFPPDTYSWTSSGIQKGKEPTSICRRGRFLETELTCDGAPFHKWKRIIYDVIVEPPSVGSMTDEHGHQRPVAFLAYRVNGQYIMEGLASSFLFTMGGLGFIILDRSNAPNIPKLNRFLLLFIGFVCVLLSFFMARVFMRMKLP